MKLYIHFGFPRTGTKTFQIHFFPNHPQINYLGRHPQIKPHLELQRPKLIDLINWLNKEDFDKRYSEILKKVKGLYLDPNKTNIISSESIINDDNFIDNDNFRITSRFASRIQFLFSKINVDVNFFGLIRNQSEIIPSTYTASKGVKLMGGEEIIQYLKTKNINKPIIKGFLNSFYYWELYKNLSKVVEEEKIKFFLYEKFRDDNYNFLLDLSNYLEIDPAISIKLLKYKSENRSSYYLKEDLRINSPFSIICFKLMKNFKNPNILFQNFNKKLLNLFKLLLIQMREFKRRDKEFLIIKKDKLIEQLNIIKNNSTLIKTYYRQDCLALKKELGLDIDKYDYF